MFLFLFCFFASEMIWIWAAWVFTLQLKMRNSVVACSCTELSLLSVEKNLWLFKKCWKKGLEKKMFFYWCSYTLCIQTIMNTNKVNVSARLLFIKHTQDSNQVLTWHLLIPKWTVSKSTIYIAQTFLFRVMSSVTPGESQGKPKPLVD